MILSICIHDFERLCLYKLLMMDLSTTGQEAYAGVLPSTFSDSADR